MLDSYMPNWAVLFSLYTFTLALAFYSGRLTVKVDTLKEIFSKLELNMDKEFESLHKEIELVRQSIDTRKDGRR